MDLLRITIALAFLFVGPRVDAAQLRLVIDGLTAPISIADPNDGTGRVFIQEQQGVIQVLEPSGALATPLLDLRAQLLDTRIVNLDADAAGELYILINDELGPYGTTGKVFKLIP